MTGAADRGVDPAPPDATPTWIERSWGARRVRTEPGALDWVEWAMRTHGSLYAAAAADHEVEASGGRGPVFGIRLGGEAWMVRHYRRGGALGDLLDDRYVAVRSPRPFREQAASRLLRRAGVPTPAVLAAAVYGAGPFYRGDLVTEWVERSTSLLERLAAVVSTRPETEAVLVGRTGNLARSLAGAGALHVDFNCGNVLAVGDDVSVIDLDRCRVGLDVSEISADRACRRMLDRLERSIRKTVTGGEPIPPVWTAALRAGAVQAP